MTLSGGGGCIVRNVVIPVHIIRYISMYYNGRNTVPVSPEHASGSLIIIPIYYSVFRCDENGI